MRLVARPLVQAVAEGKDAPIPFEEIVEVTQTTLSLVQSTDYAD